MDTVDWIMESISALLEVAGLTNFVSSTADTVEMWAHQEQVFILKLAVATVLLIFCWVYIRRTLRQHWQSSEGMPDEIKRAKLFMSEENISCLLPTALHGTPDQVYRTSGGDLIPVDTKTGGGRLYLSHTVQLSVYRTILIGMGHSVTSYGYVRLVVDRRVTYKKVELWTPERIVQLKERRDGLKRGDLTPRTHHNAKLCAGCHYQQKCEKKVA
tara:strand:- start:1264 stop:1905 length:642 start_codon:yes stop_codon:yes gene_type:complete